LQSMHDIPKKYNNTHIKDCINKYIRRHTRLINVIRSNKQIFFIRENIVVKNQIATEEETSNFVSLIKSINPLCRFALIVVGDSMKPFKDNVAWIKLSTKRAPITWQTNNLAWNELWSLCNTIKPLL